MRDRILKKVSAYVVSHPALVITAALFVSVLSILLSVARLEVNTNQDDLVSESLPYHRRYKDYLREFGDFEYIYVVVDVEAMGGARDVAKGFIERLASRLSGLDGIKEVVYKLSNPVLERSFLLYLPKEKLSELAHMFKNGVVNTKRISSWKGLDDIIRSVNEILKAPDIESRREEATKGFKFMEMLVDGMALSLEGKIPPPPDLSNLFLDEATDKDGFLFTANGKLAFLLIMPEKRYDTLSVIEKPLREIRGAIEETKREFPNVVVGLTGRPVLAADEMSTTNLDMTRATLLAVAIMSIIFFVYFKGVFRPLAAVMALLAGISWTFGLTTLVIGHLNLLSSVFAVILVGAGMEFGLQLLARYLEGLGDELSVKAAIEMAIQRTGKGNLTAALTTSAAFFAIMFTRFTALSELGFIAGTGILLCLASLLTFLPAMLCIIDGRTRRSLNKAPKVGLRAIGKIYKRPFLLLIPLVAVTTILLPHLKRLSFDHNLLRLQAKGLESVEYEEKIIEKSDESTWYAISIGQGPEDALRVARLAKGLGSVGKVETFETIIPPEQDEKAKIIEGLRTSFEDLMIPEAADSIDISSLASSLEEFADNINRLTEAAFGAGYTEAVEELERVGKKVDGIIGALKEGRGAKYSKTLIDFQRALIQELGNGLRLLKGGLNPTRITKDDLPSSITTRFISKNGRYATYIYPAYDIWDPKRLEEFVGDIRNIDGSITGTPIEVFESSRLLQDSFLKSALYALVAIVVIVIADFKRMKYAFLAITPLFAGLLWLLEVMGLCRIDFNLANFFGIPILIGVGVDNGVQIVRRFIDDRFNIESVGRSTGAAVILTSLSTALSFGMLILARHRGIRSLGVIMTIGALMCLIGSLLLLPPILKLTHKDRAVADNKL